MKSEKNTGAISAFGMKLRQGATEEAKEHGLVIVDEAHERQFIGQCKAEGLRMECVGTSEGKGGDHTLYADRAMGEGLKATGCAVTLRHYGNVTVRDELCGRMEMALNAAGEAYEVTDAADTMDGGTVYRYERTK